MLYHFNYKEYFMFTWKKYIYEVYREKSFSKAAQNLYISQPSLSARVKKVEKEIGFPLFDRSTSPLQLTEVGEVYIKAAEVCRLAPARSSPVMFCHRSSQILRKNSLTLTSRSQREIQRFWNLCSAITPLTS